MYQQYVSNTPIVLAKNLRFLDSNGLIVTQLLPIGMNGTTVNDNPETGYISRIGSVLSSQIDKYEEVTRILDSYYTSITTLQKAVSALQTSGTTIPTVNGKCFTGNALAPITTVTELIATSLCSYQSILGDVGSLANAVARENAFYNLSAASAFSQRSTMSALAGWQTSGSTIANSLSNLWLSYLDSRAGITTVLAAVTPTCASVIIDYSPTLNTAKTAFIVYFSGYTYIPSGYTDIGSTINIVDGLGGTYTAGINLVTQSGSGVAGLNINISGTTLSSTALSYTVTVNSILQNSTLGVTCNKVTIRNTIPVASAGSTYVTGTYTTDVMSSGTTTLPLITGLSFTPSYVEMVPVDTLTGNLLHTRAYYITKSAGSANLVIIGAARDVGPFNFNWIAFK